MANARRDRLSRQLGRIVLATAALVSGTTACEAVAAPITYITSGVSSGDLEGVPFTSQAFTITMVADASQVQDGDFYFGVNNTSTVVQLGASRLTAPAGSSYVSKTANPGAAQFYSIGLLVGDEFDSAPIDVFHAGFAGYDLKSPLGPLSITQGRIGLQTDQGFLNFSSVSQLQFTAVVPEPQALALGGCSAFAAGLATRWRARQAIA